MKSSTHFVLTLQFGVPSEAKEILSTKHFSTKSIDNTKKLVFLSNQLESRIILAVEYTMFPQENLDPEGIIDVKFQFEVGLRFL